MGSPSQFRARLRPDRDPSLVVAVLVVAMLALNLAAGEKDPCDVTAGWVFESGLQTLETTEDRVCSISVAVVTPTPVFHTNPSVELPGGGDFRAARVTAIEVEAMTARSEPGGCGLPLTLVLRSNGGKVTDSSDDNYAYLWDDYEGLLIAPCAGEGWLRFRFEIPSDVVSALPAGWTGGHQADPLAFRSGVDWSDVITNVDRIELWWGAPSLESPPRTWVIAVDSIEIKTSHESRTSESLVSTVEPLGGFGGPGGTWDQSPIVLKSLFEHIDDGP